ncbi:MAG: aminotransferase class V-fold PLP-dependent enzyme, partial [Candidatus Geothermincolia bacterium]
TGLDYSNSGVQSARAVYTLFALAGHLDVPGGIGLTMRGSQFPINRSCNLANPALDRALARQDFPIYSEYRGESHAIGILDSVLHGRPYRLAGLIIQGSSLLTSWPQTPLWREALAGLEFVCCIDRQMTADAAYADIVLPATSMFENLSYAVYGPVFRVREKLIEPVGEARNDYLIMAGLAERLGYGHLFPQSEEEMVRLALEGSGYTLEQVREAGGWVRLATPMMEYRKWEKGGLRDDGRPGFETPSGKFEIWSTRLEEYGYEPLPKYVEPEEGPLGSPHLAAEYPLVFNSGARPDTDFRSQHHGIDGLVRDYPEPTVDMNPADAGERGVEDGDLVMVKTARGRMNFRARVTSSIMGGAVEIPMGGGTPVGPPAWREWNVNELTDAANLDRISGFPVYKSLLCQVERVEGESRAACRRESRATSSVAEASAAPRVSPGERVYLDNNATTRVAPEVREAMLPYLDEAHGNPSSIHARGRDAHGAMENARRHLARLIHAQPRRVIFTAGGTEADNLAIKGVAWSRRDRGDHVVTSVVEHSAVLESCRFLERQGYRVTYLPVDRDGLVSVADLEAALDDRTILVSIMQANNEVGTVMPVRELAAAAHRAGALFHTDAVQAVGKIAVDVEELGVDLLSLSGHKIHAPKGVGALFARKGVELESLLHGGKQEAGRRGGTENLPAIVGLGRAAELASRTLEQAGRIQALRDKLEAGIRELVPEAVLNGHPALRVPNTLNMTLPGIRGESLVISLDHHGVELSSGSACKSGSPKPTHVLLAMGRAPAEAHASVRFSLSRFTDARDIERAVEMLALVLEERSRIRLMPCK